VSAVAIATAAAMAAVPSATFGLANAPTHHGFVVAESETGQVTRVFRGGPERAILGGAPGVAGVAASPRRVFAVIGGPSEEGAPSGGKYGSSRVLRMSYKGRHVKVIANLLRYELRANPGTVGCDPVPTGVQVRNGSLYVSTLGAEAPGAGRIYKLNARTGKVQRVWKGFTAPTGIAVRRDGTIYFSEVLFGAPEGPPPANFDPSSVGRITRIANGHITHSQVTMPTGLALKHGHLYASAWSVGFFLGIPHAGQVVRVRESSFH
jgi:hypothetical protein